MPTIDASMPSCYIHQLARQAIKKSPDGDGKEFDMTVEHDLVAIRGELQSTLDHLNSTWDRISDALRELQFPFHASVLLGEDETGRSDYLSWDKIGGKWQVCYTTFWDGDEQLQTIKAVPAQQRLALLDKASELYRKLVEKAVEFNEKAAVRISKSEKSLGVIEAN